MRRRKAAVLLPAVIAATLGVAAAGERPPVNILLVTLDTTRADRLGAYGAKDASTPNLDALAAEGVRFDRAISPAPLTLPSHASILTGMVPRRHGVRNNTLSRLGAEPQVLADLLRRQGYRTAAFVSSVVLDRVGGLSRGFEHYDDTVRIGAREAFNYEERAASQTNAAVFSYLETLAEPFFLWVHYFDPHLPYVPPEPFRQRFAGRAYDGEIAFMDDQLGELLAAVRGRAESLLVVVAADHGESLGEHGEAAHGVFVYEATQRVPLIMAGPGVPSGVVVEEPVGLVDVAPTLLDLLGLAALDDADGRSVVPSFGDRGDARQAYELESLFAFFAYGWAPERALVRGDYKYVDAPRGELYRLSTDPAERENLVRREPGPASRLARELRSLTAGDTVGKLDRDPELAEQRRRVESLGYLGGGGNSDEASSIDARDGITWISDLEAGRRAYQTGKPADGIEPLRRLLARNPRNVPALLALAMCHLGNGNAVEAVRADRRALAIRPGDDLVHFNLANALSVLGEKDPRARVEARTHYERALELSPRFADAYLNYASFLERAGADADALALIGRARSAGVRDPDLEARLAVLELKRGGVSAAKAALGRALELNPRAADALEAMARITYRQGLHEQSSRYYERLLEVSPSAGVARRLGAIRLEHLGDRAGARRAYARALELTTPDSPDREALRVLVEDLSRSD